MYIKSMNNRLHNENVFTMDDIASQLGISKSTVSRALSGSSRISPETKKKVQEFARDHGFRPNLVAKALAGRKTLNIAAIMPFEATSVQMMFFHECLSGMVKRSSQSGYSVLVCMTGNSRESENNLKSVLDNRKVDAAVLTQLKHDDANVKILRESGIPFVVIGSGAGEDVVHVDSRMKENCRDFTLKCLSLLKDDASLLFVCGSLDVEANNNRLSGFMSAMETGSGSMKYAVCTEASDIKDEVSLKNWDLILCSDDVVCAGVMEVLKEKKIKIGSGDGPMLASFHDSILLESNDPGISAVKVDAYSLGEKSADVVLKMLSPDQDYQMVNYVDSSFEFRQSTMI